MSALAHLNPHCRNFRRHFMFVKIGLGLLLLLWLCHRLGPELCLQSPALGGKRDRNLLRSSFRFAEKTACPASAGQPPVPVQLLTQNPVLPVLYIWSLVKTLPLPSISICSCLKLTGSKLLPLLALGFFPSRRKRLKVPGFCGHDCTSELISALSRDASTFWVGREHECSQGVPVSGGHRACLYQPDGNSQGQR